MGTEYLEKLTFIPFSQEGRKMPANEEFQRSGRAEEKSVNQQNEKTRRVNKHEDNGKIQSEKMRYEHADDIYE